MAAPLSPLLAESRALVDALGYVDAEYSDAQAQALVQRQIRAEMRAFQPREYLAFLPAYEPTFGGSRRLQAELRRVAAGVTLDAVDLSRYNVAAPAGKRAESVDAWESAVRQQQAAVEHEGNRVVNLELQQAYGTKLAKARAVLLDGVNAQCARALSEARDKAERVNRERQEQQARNAPQLTSYRRRLDELLAKNASIKRACAREESRASKKAKAEPVAA